MRALALLLLCLMPAGLLAFGTPPQKTETPPPSGEAAPPPAGSPSERLLQALLAGRMTQAQERQLGERIVGNLLGAAPLVTDAAVQRYVNRIGRWVASQSELPDLDWRFGVIQSEDLNAFAAPGGYVLITQGLFRRLNNEAELAGVLGHEIGHVVRRDHVKLLQRSQLLASLSGVLGQKVASDDERLQSIIGRGAEVAARSLDKSTEFEADRIAMVLAARAGYDAYGLPLVLQEIGHFPEKDDRVALLFATHPHPDARFNHLADAVGARFDDLDDGKLLAERFQLLLPVNTQ
jgi:predicted Zn-dependent protease